MATLHTPLPEMRHPTPPHSPRPWPKRLVLPPSPPTSEPGVLSPIRPALKPLLVSLDSFSPAPILIPSFPYRYPSFPFNTETYGHQMSTAPALPIRAILIGKLIAGHALRREQVNRCVTSGVGVDGRESGYGSAGRNLETAARKAEAEMELSPSDSLMDVIVFENLVRCLSW